MRTAKHLLMAAAVALGLGGFCPAFAHSSSSGSSGSSGSAGGMAGGTAGATGNGGTNTTGNADPDHNVTPNCPKGYVYKSGACLHASLGVLPDRELYAQGRALALSGYYGHALPILEAVVRTDDPMVFTMRGFASRKLGQYDVAMKLYDRALAIDPDNIDTHEYIGESYVELHKPDLARIELAKVARHCGPGCEQYDDLAEAIETGKTE